MGRKVTLRRPTISLNIAPYPVFTKSMHLKETTTTLGISQLHHPIQLQNSDGSTQHSVASCTATAHNAHASEPELARHIQNLLPDLSTQIAPSFWHQRLLKAQQDMGAQSINFQIDFPFFINKEAPVTKLRGLMEYECSFSASSEKEELTTILKVPITTLCPCSKEISDGGAHNQRAEAILTVHTRQHIWLEELITLIEDSASCPVYSVLKRPDEKYVTEKAFKNPMFVEDVVRKIAVKAAAFSRIEGFTISVESFESIHKHSAYAYVDSKDLA